MIKLIIDVHTSDRIRSRYLFAACTRQWAALWQISICFLHKQERRRYVQSWYRKRSFALRKINLWRSFREYYEHCVGQTSHYAPSHVGAGCSRFNNSIIISPYTDGVGDFCRTDWLTSNNRCCEAYRDAPSIKWCAALTDGKIIRTVT